MKTKKDFSTKPYNRCLQCPHRKLRCDGPRTSAMPLARWCEFMHDMKEVDDLTNAYIAEKSGVSIKTIERLMAQNCEQDIMRETARRIEDVIIGSSNQYPCILAFEENAVNGAQTLRELEQALAVNRDYKTVLDNIHASYATEMQNIREEAKREQNQLLAQVEQMKREIAFLQTENERKARIIEKIIGS